MGGTGGGEEAGVEGRDAAVATTGALGADLAGPLDTSALRETSGGVPRTSVDGPALLPVGAEPGDAGAVEATGSADADDEGGRGP
jgi:hypothetical protein